MSSPTSPVYYNASNTQTTSNNAMLWINTNSTATTTAYNNQVVVCPTITVQQLVQQQLMMPSTDQMENLGLYDRINIRQGRARIINFPDGTMIAVAANGSFNIEDKDAKVIYQAARSRDFNPFINASDKLEDFIRYCGDVGVRQGDMLGIPIKHFVQWLVIEAARADGEPTSEVLALPKPNYSQPRCRSCQRFMSPLLKADGIDFCRPICLEVKLENHRRVKHVQDRRLL